MTKLKNQERLNLKVGRAGEKPISVPLQQITDPTVLSSGTISSMMNWSSDTFEVVREKTEETLAKVKTGDLEDLETILTNQVYVLNGLFNKLVMQGSKGLTEPAILRSFPNHPKLMLNVALKAQNQTRSTIQTINELKKPKKTTFIKNQLNNVQLEVEETREQLKADGSKTLDKGTEAEAIQVNPRMETLEVIDGSKNSRRKSS